MPGIVVEQVQIPFFFLNATLQCFIYLLEIDPVPVSQYITDRSFKIKCLDIVPIKSKNPCEGIFGNKWARLDSNQRPSDYESPALTAEPRALATKRCLKERETGFEPANISLEG